MEGGAYIACDDERDWFDDVGRELVILLRSHSEVWTACCETKHIPCYESADMCSSHAERYKLSISFIMPEILSPFLATKKMTMDVPLSIHAR
jgi:hypothetical protein